MRQPTSADRKSARPEPDNEPLPPVPSDREFQLSLARTAYNYLRGYPNLDAVPVCASVPADEAFSPAYNALVLETSAQIAKNYLTVARQLVEEEISDDVKRLRPLKVIEDVEDVWNGLTEVTAEALRSGPTAFLKSTLYDVLRRPGLLEQNLLRPKDEATYAKLIQTLPQPAMLQIEQADWMSTQELPCVQDWFFGYLQVAGFNTTNLRGVSEKPGAKTLSLDALREKMGASVDDVFSSVLKGSTKLSDAVRAGKVYVCDYTSLVDPEAPAAADSVVHGERRYTPAPIALFYWSSNAPQGYPRGYLGDGSSRDGVLQPIAIRLEPKGPVLTPPNKSGDSQEPKWRIAKYFVNVACAIQHESVAHLGDCHLIMEGIAIATHRQLSVEHPVFKLLAPHLRFTLSINNGALSNLIIPGGVVATNVGPNIQWTLQLINRARKAWRWDDNCPDNLFRQRGVDAERLPAFPFRDDTLLLWSAIQGFVGAYVDYWFPDAANGAPSIAKDSELMAWFNELVLPNCCGFQGLELPSTRAQLTKVLSQILYIAGPLHASVNYPQYPLGAYMPSVAATIYKRAPTDQTKVDEKSMLDWFPPRDVALYTVSFEYLLSSIQFDVFGHYAENPQYPYFQEPKLEQALADFQVALYKAEEQIHARNRERPMPYPYQLPSRIPNSISI
jgi:arachidonate 15-lipoxygenase